MIFEYQEVRTCTASIDIDDIGNCCLLSRDLLGQERYLVIITLLGVTQIITYGPILPDFDELPISVNYNYNRFDYNDKKIVTTINKFIGDAEYVELTDIESIRDNFRDFLSNIVLYE